MLSRTHNARGLVFGPVWALVVCIIWFSAAFAQEQPAPGKPGVIKVGSNEVAIPDVKVMDQNGRKVRLYSDVFKGRVVVVSFFFTSCTLVCPLQGEVLAKLRTVLGKKLGSEVFLVSISKDPKNDTPRRLRMWAKQFGVGPGWTLVTGTEAAMSEVLWALIGSQPNQQLHSPVLLVGNDRTGVWETAAGLSSPGKIVDVIDRVSRGNSLDPNHASRKSN